MTSYHVSLTSDQRVNSIVDRLQRVVVIRAVIIVPTVVGKVLEVLVVTPTEESKYSVTETRVVDTLVACKAEGIDIVTYLRTGLWGRGGKDGVLVEFSFIATSAGRLSSLGRGVLIDSLGWRRVLSQTLNGEDYKSLASIHEN